MSISVLGIISHVPWATRWFDQFVGFVGPVGVNIPNVIVDRRIESGSTSRDLMFHLVRSPLEEGRAVLIISRVTKTGRCLCDGRGGSSWLKDSVR